MERARRTTFSTKASFAAYVKAARPKNVVRTRLISRFGPHSGGLLTLRSRLVSVCNRKPHDTIFRKKRENNKKCRPSTS